jgi:hypothetical protein
MDFPTVVTNLNSLLTSKQPAGFDSSWVRRHAPDCYRFIQKNVRREYGGIDWDSVTYALDRRFQPLWRPRKLCKRAMFYEDRGEIEAILRKHRNMMYVFIAPCNKHDSQIADRISISLVRLAQKGNTLARRELSELMRFTVDRWIEGHAVIARWRGYEEEIQRQLEGCIRRYRYTGSFLTYVYRTLEYAGRGIMPARVHSFDNSYEPAVFE